MNSAAQLIRPIRFLLNLSKASHYTIFKYFLVVPVVYGIDHGFKDRLLISHMLPLSPFSGFFF
jgi:hypothetical protein